MEVEWKFYGSPGRRIYFFSDFISKIYNNQSFSKFRMKLKQKLLIATDSFLPRWDGSVRFLLDIIPCLVNQFDITVLCPKFHGEVKLNANLKIVRLPIKKLNREGYSKVSLKPINDLINNSDIVFVNSLGPIGKNCVNIAYKVRKPVISYVHHIYWELLSQNRSLEPIIKKSVLLATKNLYKKCSLLIVPSIHTANLLENELIKTPKVIVNAGINTGKFLPVANKENAKEFIGVEKTRKVLGFVGRLSKEKDLMTLYEAFKRLEIRYNNLFLLIIGKGNKRLEKLFKKEDNIRLIKSTNNIVPYLRAMDIFVMPSLAETSSIATIEAMACGLPVVVTETGDLKRYIKDKENGVFFSKKNSLLLSLKLEWLLREDFVRQSLGLNARETVENVFRLELTRKKIKRIFESF